MKRNPTKKLSDPASKWVFYDEQKNMKSETKESNGGNLQLGTSMQSTQLS